MGLAPRGEIGENEMICMPLMIKRKHNYQLRLNIPKYSHMMFSGYSLLYLESWKQIQVCPLE